MSQIDDTLKILKGLTELSMKIVHDELVKTHSREDVNKLHNLLEGLSSVSVQMEVNHADIAMGRNDSVANSSTDSYGK